MGIAKRIGSNESSFLRDLVIQKTSQQTENAGKTIHGYQSISLNSILFKYMDGNKDAMCLEIY